MDAGTTHLTHSWCMRWGEHATRVAMVTLVLTGQMLPAGSVAAQDGPPTPTLVAPESPPDPPVSEAITPAAQATAQAEPTPIPSDALPKVVPGVAPQQVSDQAGTHSFGEWTVTIRPGSVPAQPAPRIQTPKVHAPVPQTRVSVTVNNAVFPQPWLWSVPSTYPNWWTAPTSAYLFQRPRPYWQLRSDFHHLLPFLPGLWY